MMSRSSVMLRFCWLFCSSPTRVLDYHGRYLNAKRQNEPTAIWWNAVACRRELQKTGDPAKEEQRSCHFYLREAAAEQQGKPSTEILGLSRIG